jgi:YVTN family beta-propeller protein
MRKTILALVLTAASSLVAPALAEEPLVLETKIPLGQVAGRIDHMAFDAAGGRLFIAELGNDSAGVVDVQAKRTIRTIPRLKHPQGVGYLASAAIRVFRPSP